MRYLLDTNVLRELGETSPHKNVAALLKSVDDANLAISALTVRETAKGVAKLRNTRRRRRWTSPSQRYSMLSRGEYCRSTDPLQQPGAKRWVRATSMSMMPALPRPRV